MMRVPGRDPALTTERIICLERASRRVPVGQATRQRRLRAWSNAPPPNIGATPHCALAIQHMLASMRLTPPPGQQKSPNGVIAHRPGVGTPFTSVVH